MMGITPVSVYMESAAGIEDGGRTGVSAITVAFFFFISLFFSPILASIPAYATGPALILIGVMLIAHVDRIQWDNVLESVPAFLTLIIMPFTLSVAYGVIAGIIAHLALHAPIWMWQFLIRQCLKLKKRRRRRIREKKMMDGEALDSDDDDDDADVNGRTTPPYPNSFRRGAPRRVHRKIFGIDGSQRSISESGSVRGDLAYLEMAEGLHRTRPGTTSLGGGGAGLGISVPIAGAAAHGMRRSASHGSFRGLGSGRLSPTAAMQTNMMGVSSGAPYGANSRPSSLGHEPVLGSTGGGGGPPPRRIMRTISGQGLGMGMNRLSGGGRAMGRSRTFTEAFTSYHGYPGDGTTGQQVQGSFQSSPTTSIGGSGHSSFQLFPSEGGADVAQGSETQDGARFSPLKPATTTRHITSMRPSSGPPSVLSGGSPDVDNNLLFSGGLLNINLDESDSEGDEAEQKYVIEEPLTLHPGHLKEASPGLKQTSPRGAVAVSTSAPAAPPPAVASSPSNENFLFGGGLLNLDLDAESDDGEESSDDGESKNKFISENNDGASGAISVPDLGVHSSNATQSMETIESVDLAAFRLGMASGSEVGSPPLKVESFKSDPGVSTNDRGGDLGGYEIATTSIQSQSQSNAGHGRPHGSGGGGGHFGYEDGSLSFQTSSMGGSKKHGEGSPRQTTHQPGSSTERVEGWPTSPGKQPPKAKFSPKQAGNLKEKSSPQTRAAAASGSPQGKNAFDVVSSEAATRLRNLFNVDDSKRDLGSSSGGGGQTGIGGSRPPQLPRVLSSPASFAGLRADMGRVSRNSSSSIPIDETASSDSSQSSAPGAQNDRATPPSPFE